MTQPAPASTQELHPRHPGTGHASLDHETLKQWSRRRPVHGVGCRISGDGERPSASTARPQWRRRVSGPGSGPPKSGGARYPTNSLNLIAAILTVRSSGRVTPVSSFPKLIRPDHHSPVWGVRGSGVTAGPAPVLPLVRSLRHGPACPPQSLARHPGAGCPALQSRKDQ